MMTLEELEKEIDETNDAINKLRAEQEALYSKVSDLDNRHKQLFNYYEGLLSLRRYLTN